MFNPKAFAVILALCGSSALAQDRVDVPLDQASAVAAQALVNGDAALALQIAEAVVAARPDDRSAHVVIAAAAPRLGDPAKGRRAGARAWALSRSDAQKYEAARLTALAAANEQRFTLSTFWLRRALTVAPDEAARTQTLSDARIVRQRNPWSTQLSFSLTPSSNLNGGSETDELVVDGVSTGGQFSDDSQALAGWRASLGLGTQYRFQQNAQSRSLIGLQYQIGRSKITDDASVPDEGFDSAVTELSLRHDRALSTGTISARASHTRFDYRDFIRASDTTVGEYYQISRAGLSRQIPIDNRTVLSFSYDRERVRYSIDAIGDVNRNIISTSAGLRLDGGNQIRGTFTLTDSDGDNPNYTSNQQSVGVSYEWAEPIGPLTLSIGGRVAWTDYPDFNLPLTNIANGRQDTTVSAFANIGFPEFSYAGFIPGLRLDAAKTDSNVSRYARNSLSLGFTLRSQF